MQQPNTAAAKQSKRVQKNLKNTYLYYKNTLFSAVRCWIGSEKSLRVRMWRKEDLHAKFTTISKISHKQFTFHICFLVDVPLSSMPILMSQTILDTSIKVIVKYAVNKVITLNAVIGICGNK